MADLNIIGPQTLQELRKNIEEISAEAFALQTQGDINKNLGVFFKRAENYQKQLLAIETVDKKSIILEPITNRGRILVVTKELITIQYILLEIYEFLQKFREVITKEKLKYVIGVETPQENGQTSITLGVYSFEELLSFGDMDKGIGLISLGLTSSGIFSLRMGIENTESILNDLIKSQEQNYKISQKNKEKIINTYKEHKSERIELNKINKKTGKKIVKAARPGFTFESSIKSVAAKGDYKYQRDSASALRTQDINKEIAQNLINEEDTNLQVKLLQNLEESRGATLMSMTSLKNAIDFIVYLKHQQNIFNYENYLKVFLFEANSNFTKKTMNIVEKTIEQKANASLSELYDFINQNKKS